MERLYGVPVLLSGLATLVLSTPEVAIFSGHFKQHIERLLKLYRATPDPVVWFLAGCLPGQALLHLRQASLFGMICRLNNGNNILANHARNVYSSAKASSKSWFLQVQGIFLLYNLPHPITFLENPPSKFSFKRLVKAAVLDHWQDKLRMQASMLSSLEFFKPGFMSLSTTHYPPNLHNMWRLTLPSCESNCTGKVSFWSCKGGVLDKTLGQHQQGRLLPSLQGSQSCAWYNGAPVPEWRLPCPSRGKVVNVVILTKF